MAYIILPSRWTKQPTGLVELDYSNPLLNELVAGYSSMPTWYRMGSDLIRRTPASTPAGATTMPNNLTVQPSPWGPLFSRSFSTSTPSMTVLSNSLPVTTATSFTVFGLINATGATSAVNRLHLSNAGGGFPVPGIREGSGGANVFQAMFRSSTPSDVIAADVDTPTTFVRYACAARYVNGDGIYLFVNGAQKAYTASALNLTLAPTLMSVNAGIANMREAALGLAWRRALDDTEIAELSLRPWQIFKPILRRIFFPSSAAPITGSASFAFSNSGVLTGAGALVGVVRLALAQAGH